MPSPDQILISIFPAVAMPCTDMHCCSDSTWIRNDNGDYWNDESMEIRNLAGMSDISTAVFCSPKKPTLHCHASLMNSYALEAFDEKTNMTRWKNWKY